MSEFWRSSLGEVTGLTDEAFTKSFDVIPNGTMAFAVVKSCKFEDDFKQNKIIRMQWEITKGDFAKTYVTQNIKVYDPKDSIRHTALNMLMLLFKMFNIGFSTDVAPSDKGLGLLAGKEAGIKIAEYYKPQDDGKLLHGNYVTEVHPVAGFVPATGKAMKAPEPLLPAIPGMDSALQRNAQGFGNKELDDDVMF